MFLVALTVTPADRIAAEGRPLPRQPCPLDMPDDFFRIRLVCVLLDTCGMCFDRGTQRKKLDNFLTFFQVRALAGDLRRLTVPSTMSTAKILCPWT